MRTIADLDVERLARRESREQLPFLQLLRLYLDPSPLFKDVNSGSLQAQAEALEYNRRNRCILPKYAQRWGIIALLCIAGIVRLGAETPSGPLLYLPVAGLAVGLALAVIAALLNIAVYLLLASSSDTP